MEQLRRHPVPPTRQGLEWEFIKGDGLIKLLLLMIALGFIGVMFVGARTYEQGAYFAASLLGLVWRWQHVAKKADEAFPDALRRYERDVERWEAAQVGRAPPPSA